MADRPYLTIAPDRPPVSDRLLTEAKAREIHERVTDEFERCFHDARTDRFLSRAAVIAADWRLAHHNHNVRPTDWLALLTGRLGVAGEAVGLLAVRGDNRRWRKQARRALLELAALALVLDQELGDE